jgi:hypothetical protein
MEVPAIDAVAHIDLAPGNEAGVRRVGADRAAPARGARPLSRWPELTLTATAIEGCAAAGGAKGRRVLSSIRIDAPG